jgi:hypothetical protein
LASIRGDSGPASSNRCEDGAGQTHPPAWRGAVEIATRRARRKVFGSFHQDTWVFRRSTVSMGVSLHQDVAMVADAGRELIGAQRPPLAERIAATLKRWANRPGRWK